MLTPSPDVPRGANLPLSLPLGLPLSLPLNQH